MERLLEECDRWEWELKEKEGNRKSREEKRCYFNKKPIAEELKELKSNLHDEYIEGDDELTIKLREFWFGSSPFVGMGGRDFLLALRDFIRNFVKSEISKEWEKKAKEK